MSDVAAQDIVPAPASERRDEIGRLVAVTWLLLSSVAYKVVHLARLPVLIVR